ncbi:MAG: hypothetical protein U0636_01175 [Phycisphaerales bacterium]
MDFRTTTLFLKFPPTLAAALALPAAQTSDDLKPQPMSAAGTISQVTLYRGRAAVTRHIHKDIAQGVWAVRIAGSLPPCRPTPSRPVRWRRVRQRHPCLPREDAGDTASAG